MHKYLFQNTKGGLELVNNLNKEWERMRTGEQYFILYRLNFPVRSPLPTIKSITVNNQVICRGNKPSKCTEIFHIHYTTISMLLIHGGTIANGETLCDIY
jgi:hypothetical protein